MPTVAALLAASGLPLLEARALLAHELGSAREALIAHPEREVDAAGARRFEQFAARRRAGEPLAYLVGAREFYGRRFVVTPAVLVPRPETELLVQLALERAAPVRNPRVLDLGTGCGCIAISLALERPDAEVCATDISESALAIARENARVLGARVTFLQSDWYAGVEGRFDLIVSNPPYVAPGDPHLSDLSYEPQQALVAADNGLACLAKITARAPVFLKEGGWLLVEHGFDQAQAVRQMLIAASLMSVCTQHDAAHLERVTQASKASRESSRQA